MVLKVPLDLSFVLLLHTNIVTVHPSGMAAAEIPPQIVPERIVLLLAEVTSYHLCQIR